MDAVEAKLLKRYEELENKPSPFFIASKEEVKQNYPKKTPEPMSDNAKKIPDLRDQLFDTIEQLKAGKIDIAKAKTIADIAQVIVNSAKVEVDFIRTVNAKGSYFFPAGPKQIEGKE